MLGIIGQWTEKLQNQRAYDRCGSPQQGFHGFYKGF